MSAIVVLDVETTGKDRARDQIIELCLLGLGGADEAQVWRIKPTVPIAPEAQAVHGITAEALATCPAFADVAPRFLAMLDAAEVIVGYNVAFDLDFVQAELARAGMQPLDLTRTHVVDVLRLWHHVEPRTLTAAHEKFCGKPLVDAHRAEADVAATARVLGSMLETFGLAGKPWPELAAIANPFPGRANWIGPSHHVQWNADGQAAFAFGKYSGKRVIEVDPGFLLWVIGKDFPPHVKEVCRLAMQPHEGGFDAAVAAKFPRVAPGTEAA